LGFGKFGVYPLLFIYFTPCNFSRKNKRAKEIENSVVGLAQMHVDMIKIFGLPCTYNDDYTREDSSSIVRRVIWRAASSS
jgi:hypothetical protein